MNCDRCDNEANIEIIVSDGGVSHTVHLCFDCYEELMEMGLKSYMTGEGEKFIGDILKTFKGSFFTGLSEIDDDGTKCPKCGKTISDIVADKKFGCQYCYSEFAPRVNEILQNIQGSNKHIGKYPKEYAEVKDLQARIETEKLKLEDKISKEAYEEAAEVKMEIDQLKEKLEELVNKLDG